MVPDFPVFSILINKHRDAITEFSEKFEPYSDFNFTSLFCWNTDNSTEVSMLNQNLVIKMSDYTTGESIYSILGETEIDTSLQMLLKFTKQLNIVPDKVIQNIKNKQYFKIEEERDQFDYIYNIKDHTDLAGRYFKIKRNKINHFLRNYGEGITFKKIDFNNPATKDELITTFNKWAQLRQKTKSESQREGMALQRLFECDMGHRLVGVQIFHENSCIGFSVNEVLNDEYAICHFQKAIVDYEHTDVFLTYAVTKDIAHFGCKYINWEQDLGIEGLRALKQSYKPILFLKKYKVSI